MMKKLISLLLLLSLAVVPMLPAQAEETAETPQTPETSLLTALGIFDESTEESITTNQGYILHILRLLNEKPAPAGNTASVFPDVETNVAEMNRAYMMGLVTGKNGKLYPQEAITLQEAVIMMTKALGYKIMAEQEGGYPNGYLQVANRLHLLSGVPDADLDAALTYPQAAVLFDNALTIPILYSKYLGETVEYIQEEDVTVLTQYHDVFEKKGVITANRYANISGSEFILPAGEVVIDSESFQAGETNAEAMVGHKVSAYYQYNEKESTAVLLYVEDKSAEVLTVNAADIEPGDSIDRIDYINAQDKTKTIRFPADMVTIFNGKRCFDLTVQDLHPESGSLTFIDNDSDGGYDVLNIVSYAACVVKTVIDNTEIVDFYQKTQLDLDTLEYYTMTSNGEPVEPVGLDQWDVLSVAMSKDGQIADIRISTQKVTGQVTGLYEEGVKINGQEYDYLPVYEAYRAEDAKNAEQVGDAVQAYLDFEGRIAAVDLSWNVGRTGILVKAVAVEEAEDEYLFTIVDRENEGVKYKAAKKVKVDGITYQHEKILEAVQNMKRYYGVVPIVYDLNAKSEIIAIDTPEQGADERESLRPLCENESITYVREAHSFSARFFFGGSTMLTYVPEDPNDLEQYVIQSMDMVRSDMTKTISAFAVGDSVIADIILIREDAGQTAVSNTETFALVEGISTAINEDDEPIHVMQVYKDGMRAEVKTEDLETLTDVEPGDVIFYELSANNTLKQYAELYKKGVLGEFDTSLSGTGRLAGRVYAREDSIIGLSFSENLQDPGTIQYLNLFNRPPIYIYDTKTDTVTTGSIDDILDYKSSGSSCSQVFVQTRFSVVKGVVIYR